MITQNDLLDFKPVLCNIRMDPEFDKNYDIILSLINELNSPLLFENKIRIALSKLDLLNNENWAFVYHENIYAYTVNIKDENIYIVFTKSFEYLLKCIKEKNYLKMQALADILHNLPPDICENSYKIPANFYKNELKFFRKNWDSHFLK